MNLFREIKGQYHRISRACSWWLHIYKQPAWAADEYAYLIEDWTKRLIEMADIHEEGKIYVGYKAQAQKMRLAAKLLKMYADEHYWSAILHKPYNHEEVRAATAKDIRCKDLAFKIISNNIAKWWV